MAPQSVALLPGQGSGSALGVSRKERLRSRGSQAGPPQPTGPCIELSRRIKRELRARYAAGERPEVNEYLGQFPELRAVKDRVVSLLYLEYCLREKCGEQPDPAAFCERYEPWRDSLISQLNYHQVFSRVMGPAEELAEPCFPEPGEHFLWFRLDAELGKGGAGRVYLARDESLGGRRVALKVSLDRGDEPSIQGRLDHPHIVPVTLVERDPETGLRGLCMPYFAGKPLSQVIEDLASGERMPRSAAALWEALGPPTTEDATVETTGRPAWSGFPHRGSHADAAAWVCLKVAEALEHAHASDVLHRDIKPANILLTRRGGPLLLDFNLSQAPNDAGEAHGIVRGGTLPYMAPEHLGAFLDPDRWARLDRRTDIYSLGLVLRELLTGRRPELPELEDSTEQVINDLLDERCDAPPPSVRLENPAVPHALDAIINRCLQPRPSARYQTATELATDLRCFLQRKPLCEARNPSTAERLANWIGGHLLPISVVAGVGLVAAVLALVRPDHRYVHSVTMDTEAKLQAYLKSGGSRAAFESALAHLGWLGDLGYPKASYWKLSGDDAMSRNDYQKAVACYRSALRAAGSDALVGPHFPANVALEMAQPLIDWAEDLRDNAAGLATAAHVLTDESRELFLTAESLYQEASGVLDSLSQSNFSGKQDQAYHTRLALAYAGRGYVHAAFDEHEAALEYLQKAKHVASSMSAKRRTPGYASWFEPFQAGMDQMIRDVKEQIAQGTRTVSQRVSR